VLRFLWMACEYPRVTRCNRSLVGLCVALSTLLAACGGSTGQPASEGDSAPTVSQSPSPSAPPTTKIKPYMDKLASESAQGLLEAVRMAAPGSLAAAYVQHQANQAMALDDAGGDPGEPGSVTQEGSSYKVCYTSTDDKGKNSIDCYVYSDFKLAPDGAVASYTVDKKPLAGRLTLGNGQRADSALGSVTFLSAYRTQDGREAVAVKVRTKSKPIYIHDAAATYRAPNGRQRVESAFTGPGELGANSVANCVFYFTGPIGFGGAMSLELNVNGDDYADPATVTIKTK
jgi:hypothetical protein